MRRRILIQNGTIVNEGLSFRGSLFIVGDVIADITDSEADLECYRDQADEVVDADGMLVLPGVIDTHVHFRQPGAESKETLASGSAAAVLGGVTSFVDMPNNNPPAVTLDALAAKRAIAARDSLANYSFYIGATDDNIDQILSADPRQVAGVKVFMGSSTGNMLVADDVALERIFSIRSMPVGVHCEDEATIVANMAAARMQYGEDMPASAHPRIRSREACLLSTRRAVSLAERFGAHLHVHHVTTAEELQLIGEAKGRGVEVTCETTPNYLWFCDADYEHYGNRIKCNPAIKGAADREALRSALRDGLVDTVATDHAPHRLADKLRPYAEAPSGIPSVQISLQMMLSLAQQGAFSIERVVDAMCHAPARLLSIKGRGFLRPGNFADITVVDPCRSCSVKPASACGWTPLDSFGITVLHTFVNGAHVVRDGALTGQRDSEALVFER